MRLVGLLIAILAVVNSSVFADSWRAEIVDFGTYDITAGAKVENEDVAGNLTETYSKTLLKQSDQVFAKIGVNFGFRYKLIGSGDGAEVIIRVKHPKKLKDPNTGKEFSQSEWSQWVPTNHVNWNTGWIFESDWEIAAGKWVMQLLVQDKLLLEKTFYVSDARGE